MSEIGNVPAQMPFVSVKVPAAESWVTCDFMAPVYRDALRLQCKKAPAPANRGGRNQLTLGWPKQTQNSGAGFGYGG
jgi:hypothetical protein